MHTRQELLNLPIADLMALAGRVAVAGHYFADTPAGQALVRHETEAAEQIASAMRARAGEIAAFVDPRVDVDVQPWLVMKRPLDVAELWGLLLQETARGT